MQSNVNSLTDRCVAAASLSVDNRPTIFRSTLLLHNIIRSFYKPEHRDEPSSAHFFSLSLPLVSIHVARPEKGTLVIKMIVAYVRKRVLY